MLTKESITKIVIDVIKEVIKYDGNISDEARLVDLNYDPLRRGELSMKIIDKLDLFSDINDIDPFCTFIEYPGRSVGDIVEYVYQRYLLKGMKV